LAGRPNISTEASRGFLPAVQKNAGQCFTTHYTFIIRYYNYIIKRWRMKGLFRDEWALNIKETKAKLKGP
jgi:hypothetical protein